MNDTKDAFLDYFRRLNDSWHQQYQWLPKTPMEEDLDDDLLVGPTNGDGLVQWQAKEFDGEPPEEIAAAVTQAVLRYLYSVRFLFAGGSFGEHQIELTPITTDFLDEEFPEMLSWCQQTQGAIQAIPIGMLSDSGNTLAIANTEAGEIVALEENGAATPLASDAATFLRALSP